MNIDLESLGMTTECLANRVIDRIVDRIFEGTTDEFYSDKIEAGLTKLVASRLNDKINAIAEASLYPIIDAKIDGFILQETNAYGEAKGGPKSFTEYLCGKAEEYLMEPIDGNGRTEAECKAKNLSWYSRDVHTTRIENHISRYLKSRVEDAMKTATAAIGTVIQKSLEKTVTDVLKDMSEKIHVTLVRDR